MLRYRAGENGARYSMKTLRARTGAKGEVIDRLIEAAVQVICGPPASQQL